MIKVCHLLANLRKDDFRPDDATFLTYLLRIYRYPSCQKKISNQHCQKEERIFILSYCNLFPPITTKIMNRQKEKEREAVLRAHVRRFCHHRTPRHHNIFSKHRIILGSGAATAFHSHPLQFPNVLCLQYMPLTTRRERSKFDRHHQQHHHESILVCEFKRIKITFRRLYFDVLYCIWFSTMR